MSLVPENAKEIEVTGSTVPYIQYEENGTVIYQFNTSDGGHPMVNAMSGLSILKDGEKLEMINSKIPMGLFPKVEADFDHEVEDLVDGNYKITFIKKGGKTTTDFSASSCGGGCSN